MHPDPQSTLVRRDVKSGEAMLRWLRECGVTSYEEAHRASVQHVGNFWAWAWRECGLVGEPGGTTLEGSNVETARFFPHGSVDVVATLLAGDVNEEALVAIDETGSRVCWTRGQLTADVAACAGAMRAAGVVRGDRVAAWAPNVGEVVIWALAALSIGAVVSSASPDFAAPAVVDRFGQIEPTILLVGSHYVYGGRSFDLSEQVERAVPLLPTLRTVVVLGEGQPSIAIPRVSWNSWLRSQADVVLETTMLPFDHPGFILFSSGTTGAPKCIVHSAGGVLLKDLVEQRVHLDIRPGDRISYFTTCGWMMWNWLVMSLGTGATIVLVDGNPMTPTNDRLLKLVRDEELTFLGVSAKYIESLRERNVSATDTMVTSLRTLASTGSPLAPELFDFVYDNISTSVHVASISGGTDICGCFVLGLPNEPVHRGEIQAAALGMDVRVLDDEGRELPRGERGELVCATPFPSRPLGFLGDDGTRMHQAYFARFPEVWAHGDFISRTANGGFVIHGRSDATLNSRGVRIGTAEIYRVVDAMSTVRESLAVAQRWELDTRILLFVVLDDGATLDSDLEDAIRRRLRSHASPRHVPDLVVQVPVLPRTVTGKLAELAVTDIVNGDEVRNTSGLANPQALAPFADWYVAHDRA